MAKRRLFRLPYFLVSIICLNLFLLCNSSLVQWFYSLLCLIYYFSLSAIAKKRPAFYGRILPVLLGLSPSSSTDNGVHVSGAYHALKNAFLMCLKCTHPGAAPVLFLIL